MRAKILPDLIGKHVTVIGLGTQGGGMGTVCWLLRQGACVLVSDRATRATLRSALKQIELFQQQLKQKRSHPIGSLVLHLGKAHVKEDIIGADLVVMNPDVPRNTLVFSWAKAHHIPIRIGDTSLFVERCPTPIIGVTGTRGKTTTTSLIGAIFRSVDRRTLVAGNLRISPLNDLSRLLRSQKAQRPFVVLELSSWQVEGIHQMRMSPHIGIITNIFPDHLNRYKNIREYAKAKAGLFTHQTNNDHAIINYDNIPSRSIATTLNSRVWWVSSHILPKGMNGAFLDYGWITLRSGRRAVRVMERGESPLMGDHNDANILASVLACWIAGVNVAVIRSVVRRFKGVAGRLEYIRTHNHIRYINDTAATSPEAVIAALHAVRSQSRSIILIAGGTDKQLEYQSMINVVRQFCRGVIFLPGSATTKMKQFLELSDELSIRDANSMSEAVSLARAVAHSGDTILLSPGAASFGLFQNAYDRGDQFRTLIKKL